MSSFFSGLKNRIYRQKRQKKGRELNNVDKEDFLLKQIDEFREKAKQLQELLISKESKVVELQSIVEEREEVAEQLQEEAEQLQDVLNERKEAAEGLLGDVQSHMRSMMEQVERKLNDLAEKIAADVNETTGRTAEQTAEQTAVIKSALEDISTQLDQITFEEITKQLDQMKLELAEKIHTEDVKCYRNMAKLVEEQTVKIEENDALEEAVGGIKGYVKVIIGISVVNSVALVVLILYSLGIIRF